MEKRIHNRTPIRLKVNVKHPSHGEQVLLTADISDGGAYFLCDDADRYTEGDELDVQVLNLGNGDGPIVQATVVRCDEKGIGLSFHME